MKDYESVQAASSLHTSNGFDINLPGKKDARLLKSLSLKEFVCAFNKYKRVLCRAFPQRSEKLDYYLANIMKIETRRDYHKLFSAKAATALREFKVKID